MLDNSKPTINGSTLTWFFAGIADFYTPSCCHVELRGSRGFFVGRTGRNVSVTYFGGFISRRRDAIQTWRLRLQFVWNRDHLVSSSMCPPPTCLSDLVDSPPTGSTANCWSDLFCATDAGLVYSCFQVLAEMCKLDLFSLKTSVDTWFKICVMSLGGSNCVFSLLALFKHDSARKRWDSHHEYNNVSEVMRSLYSLWNLLLTSKAFAGDFFHWWIDHLIIIIDAPPPTCIQLNWYLHCTRSHNPLTAMTRSTRQCPVVQSVTHLNVDLVTAGASSQTTRLSSAGGTCPVFMKMFQFSF